MIASPRAIREFAELSAEQVSLFTTLMERMIHGDARVEIKKMAASQATHGFRVKELWEAKANRKYRLFFDGVKQPRTILGFGHRGENGVFRRER